MAKKNTRRADSGGIFMLDNRTKAVMAQPSQDGIKEKVLAVREVVPNRSNNEIVLVLQYYDYSVEGAIQAFLEDGAKQALLDWHYPGNKPNNKKKKKKQKKAKEDQQSQPVGGAGSAAAASVVESTVSSRDPQHSETSPAITANSGNTNSTSETIETLKTTESVVVPAPSASSEDKKAGAPPLSSSEVFLEKMSKAPPIKKQTTQQKRPTTLDTSVTSSPRERTVSERSTSSVASASATGGEHRNKKPYAGLEKSVKDLQRQTTSLQRLKLILAEEVNKSYKVMTSSFEELRLAVNEREAEVMFDMDRTKKDAYDILHKRQMRATHLRQCTDRAQTMTDSELAELRADIKHFVSERKIDEDLTKAAQFAGCVNDLLKNIRAFGEVSPVKSAYSKRRPSVSSVSSGMVSHDEFLSPLTPTTPVFSPQAAHHPASFSNHSNRAEPTSSPTSQSEDSTSSPKTLASSPVLQETVPPRLQSAPTTIPAPRSTTPLTMSEPKQSDTESYGDKNRNRNARRRQKQRDRERCDSERNATFAMSDAATMPHIGDLPQSEVPPEQTKYAASNSPKRVMNRGTSPMKAAATTPSTHATPGGKHDYRNRGPKTYPKSDLHTRQTVEDQRRPGPNRQHAQSNSEQQGDYSQPQRKPRERRQRPYRSFNERSTQKNGPKNGPLNGSTSGEGDRLVQDKPHYSNGPAVQPLKQFDQKQNKPQEAPPPPPAAKARDGDNKQIEKDEGENAEPKALPQRKARNRGTKHAQEKEKSQVIVNGDAGHPLNGHS